MLVVGAVRVAGSVPVLRWPLAGGLLAVIADLSDLFLFELLDLGGVDDYQRFDKVVDQVYLAAFAVAAARWSGIERRVALGLYLFRMVGFVAYELTGERLLLLAFPNVFEVWFLLVAALHNRSRPVTWTAPRLAVALLASLAVKLVQEWALHAARLFDSIGAFEALEVIRRALLGP